MSRPDQEAVWSARYRDAGADYVFGTLPNRFPAHRAELLGSGSNALSVADGEGRNAVWMAEQGLRVTATEISPVAPARRMSVRGRGRDRESCRA